MSPPTLRLLLLAALAPSASSLWWRGGKDKSSPPPSPSPPSDGLPQLPPSPRWVADDWGLLSSTALDALEGNLTRVNATSRIRCYLAVAPSLPDGYALTPKEASKKLHKHWLGGSKPYDKSVLILVVAGAQRAEVAVGPKLKRKLAEKVLRRIVRKVNALLKKEGAAPSGEPYLEAACRTAVKQVGDQLKKEPGLFGGMRGMMMPVILGCVLMYLYMKNATAKMGGDDFGSGGMGGPGGGPGGIAGALGGMMGGGMGGMGGGGGMGAGRANAMQMRRMQQMMAEAERAGHEGEYSYGSKLRGARGGRGRQDVGLDADPLYDVPDGFEMVDDGEGEPPRGRQSLDMASDPLHQPDDDGLRARSAAARARPTEE